VILHDHLPDDNAELSAIGRIPGGGEQIESG
jgi:hypothetical protein